MGDYAFFAGKELNGSLSLGDCEMIGVNVAYGTVGLHDPAWERGRGLVEVGGEENTEGSISEHPGAFFKVSVDHHIVCNVGKVTKKQLSRAIDDIIFIFCV